jgi:4-amino-4-deoxy-L-arabinose transferase-like glycosyltransferase
LTRGAWRVWCAATFALYAASRLAGLTALPMFVDEGLHISWAMNVAQGERLDQPWRHGRAVQVFTSALLFPWIGESYLWASRALTAAFGALTLLAILALARRLHDETTALAAGALYVLCPMALFYDRLAMADPVMSAFFALFLVASALAARSGSVRAGVLAGFPALLAVLSKASGVLFLFMPIAAWLTLSRPLRRGLRALLASLVATFGLCAWPVWRFMEASRPMAERDVGGRLSGSLGRAARNLDLLADWFVEWWTLPLVLLALAGAVGAALRRDRSDLYLAAAAFLPLGVLVVTATFWYPRYVLFAAVPGLILAARALQQLVGWVGARLGIALGPGRHALLAAAVVLSLLPAARVDQKLWTDPARAPMPALERLQFLDGWPSGYGVRESVAFVKDELGRHPDGLIVVVDSRAHLTTRVALGVEFRRAGRLRLEDLPLERTDSRALLEQWARERSTLVVVSPGPEGRARPSPGAWAPLRAELALETRKPNGDLCDQVYRVAAPPAGS